MRIALRLSEATESSSSRELERVAKVFRSLIKSYNRCGSAPFVFDLLIKSCLDSKDIDGALMIVRKLRSTGINPQISTCNALISEISKRRGASYGHMLYREVFGLEDRIDEAKKSVAKPKVKPNASTFNLMMVSLYREGETEKVEKIWREMEEIGCSPNAYSYSVLMGTYCAKGMMLQAEKTWKDMKVKGVDHDVMAYNTMIGGLCSNLEVAKAEKLVQEMKLKGIECSSVTYEHLVNGYCKTGDVDSAIVVFKDMKRKSFQPEGLTIESLVDGLCDKQRVLEAVDIMKDAVRDCEFYPSRKCYELLVTRLCEEGQMERALSIQAEMVGRGFKPSRDTYEAFIHGYETAGDENTAALLTTEMAESLRGRVDEEEES